MTDRAWCRGAVVIPAHNEEASILRTLRPLADLAASGRIEVIVVPNGCSDATASVAATMSGVQVQEIAIGSKASALNEGDRRATAWPRIYLDADIELSGESVLKVLDELTDSPWLAGRPSFVWVTDEASAAVRAFYRARGRFTGFSEHLWGAGVYALTHAGHDRLGEFPDVTGDDLYVDSLFEASEIVIVACPPARVRVPTDARSLLRTLRRVYRGNRQVWGQQVEAPTLREPRRLSLRVALAGVRSPRELADLGVYVAVALIGRLQSLRVKAVWERDDSTRKVAPDSDSGHARRGAIDSTDSNPGAGDHVGTSWDRGHSRGAAITVVTRPREH